MEDDKIVRLYLERDENAIRFTSEKYGGKLRRIAFGITRNYETSEECENDTYLEAWNRIPPSDPRGYFGAFLSRITRAFAIDCCRKNTSLKRNGNVIELTDELEMCIPAIEDSWESIEAKMLGEKLDEFLCTLSDEKQAIFIRRYYFLDTVNEIAGRFSISESKVKTTLMRIRNDLRNYLLKEGYIL